jgi:hypothetical protein
MNGRQEERPIAGRLGDVVFDGRTYDPLTDLLVLTRGDTSGAVTHTTPEGHELLLRPETGEIVGLTVREYQATLFDGPIEVTFPGPFEDDPNRARRAHLWIGSLYGGMCS